MLHKLKHYFPEILLALLITFHIVGNVVWVTLNQAPPPWDEAAHTWRAIDMSYAISDLLNGKPALGDFINSLRDPYPPLMKLLAGILITLTFPDIRIIQLLGTIFFIAEIILLYHLAVTLHESKLAGLIAAYFFSFHLLVIQKSRLFSLDIALVFFITLAWYFLVKSHHFTRAKYSLLFFLALGLAVATKIIAPVYLIIPAGYAFIAGLKSKEGRISWGALLKGSVLVFILIAPWLITSWSVIYKYYRYASTGELYDPRNPLLFTTWIFYFKDYVNNGPGLMGLLFIVAALGAALLKRNKHILLQIATVVFVYIFFTLFPNKDQRYLFPLIPFLSLTVGYGISLLVRKNEYFVIPLIVGWIFLNGFNYVKLSFGSPYPYGTTDLLSPVQVPYFNDIVLLPRTNARLAHYDQGNWPLEEVLADLQLYLAQTKDCCVLLMADYEKFNANSLTMYMRLHRIENIEIVSPNPFLNSEFSEAEFDKFNYFIYTDVDLGVFDQPNVPYLKKSQLYVENLLKQAKATQLKQYTLPTGQSLLLVKRL